MDRLPPEPPPSVGWFSHHCDHCGSYFIADTRLGAKLAFESHGCPGSVAWIVTDDGLERRQLGPPRPRSVEDGASAN